MPQDFVSAGDILNQAALDLGLLKSPVEDPVASADGNQNLMQLFSILNTVGRALRTVKSWTQLGQEKLTVTDGSESYALPDDFLVYRDNTGWNRSTQFPLLGPLSDEQWQAMKAQMGVILVQTAFRIWKGRLYCYPSPTTGQNLYYEYSSKWWVQPPESDPLFPSAESVTSSDDVCWYDRGLLEAGLKYHFMAQKGFDTTALQSQYEAMIDGSGGGDGAGPRLNIAGKVLDVWGRYIDSMNIPPTGFGM